MDAAPPNSNPYAPPQAPLQDIQPQQGGQVLAGRGARLGAAFLDGLVWSLGIYVPLLATGLLSALVGMARTGQFVPGPSLLLGLGISGLMFIVLVVVTIMLVARNGQTIAKRMVGIKVVRSDGSQAGLGRIFWLRNVLNTVITMVPLAGSIYALVDILMIFGDSRQCLHDRIADTVVVNA